MTAVSLTPAGPFALASSMRFLEGFTPAGYDHADDAILRLAFPADNGVSVIGAAVRQAAVGQAVHADFTVRGPAVESEVVTAQIARILSLDVDGTGFPALASGDPVVASLQADYPGLRPVCFYSPYEAAAWTIIGNRIRMTQAAAIKASLAREHGEAVDVAGQTEHAFPAPGVLRDLHRVPGLTDIKVERLNALADAALDGKLDAATLRSLPVDQALAALRELPGIGPFSAELILIRGAGYPDVFPRNEPRVHQAIATEYGLAGTDDIDQLAAIAERWRPYRSWVALLLRARASESPRGKPAKARR
ncbi:hypothetical protein AB0H76_15780 [Nocardia sp. NPDC050712]|uniref:DNA-3-methyladenine glycosylase family protein n=1 Tax=Nocardia sp. NPDC050712 TaxID=3155518 RepID=UPI0033C37940